MKRLVFFSSLLVFGACDRVESPQPQPKPAARIDPSPAATMRPDGAALFAQQCAKCHGDEGRGDGKAAEFLFPKPRDFTQARFKVRTTPSGQMPTDADILRTLEHGLPGSAMPSFAFLTEDERRALVAHIKSLAVVEVGGVKKNRFEMAGTPTPIVVGDEPPPDLVRGRAIYQKMNCAKCHGESGVGDGPSAPTLVDADGMPAPPANFTRGLFKGGAETRDIYLRFTTGMTGSPMPSSADSLNDAERWALAQYVRSLVKKDAREVKHESFRPIASRHVERVPLDPNDPTWRQAPSTDVALMTLWQRKNAPTHVTVRVLHDDVELGVCLEWDDAAPDGAILAPQTFSDGAAVMFSVKGVTAPIFMGDKDNPCNIWNWRFERQLDLAQFQDIETSYPNAAVDGYYCDTNRYPPRLEQPGHVPLASAPSLEKLWLSGWSAGNPCSDPLRATPVQNLIAYGFGTLEIQPPVNQIVDGRGVWISGRWHVVFKRKMASPSALNAAFKPGKDVAMACAVWDGGAGDRDGQKSITFWQTIKLP